MKLKALESMFQPRSIAILGASNAVEDDGYHLIRNILKAGFEGPILPVNPNCVAVAGVLAFPEVSKLPLVPDLAIICDASFCQSVDALGELGVANLIVIPEIKKAKAFVARAARWRMRVLGPHSLGIIVPSLKLNASYMHISALPGSIAFVSQSAAICNATLEWAGNRRIGFSHVVSLGNSIDVDYATLLDYFGRDVQTKAILLYINHIEKGREFISAARAAAAVKPIIVIKAGRHLGEQPDIIYDAAFKRAGMLRVKKLQELFAALETIAHGEAITADNLTVFSNGHSIAAMAVDTLLDHKVLDHKGQLAELKEQTAKQLANHARVDHGTVILPGNASLEVTQQTLTLLLNDENVDNILLLHAPTVKDDPTAYAEAVIDCIKQHKGRLPTMCVSWVGEQAFQETRHIFSENKIASYRTPENATQAFMYMVDFRRNQKLLSQMPETTGFDNVYQPELAQEIIARKINDRQYVLRTDSAREILSCYAINTVETLLAKTIEQACAHADHLGYPVAIKAHCPQIGHASKVDGVVLNIKNKKDVEKEAQRLREHLEQNYPDVIFEGYIVQAMAARINTHELRIAVHSDAVFGPIIYLGEGAKDWLVSRDAVVGLPPLNSSLARHLIYQALEQDKLRIRHLNFDFDREALADFLTHVSDMIVQNPEIVALDINPLLMCGSDISVIDVSIHLAQDASEYTQLAIHPYPKNLEEKYTIKSGETILLRAIRPEDWKAILTFDTNLTQDVRYRRYFGEVSSLSRKQLAQFTQIDYNREMAFVAVRLQSQSASSSEADLMGEVRVMVMPDKSEAEFAIVVASQVHSLGVGSALMKKMINYCRFEGIARLVGITLLDNRNMIQLAKRLGFSVTRNFDEGVAEMSMTLIS